MRKEFFLIPLSVSLIKKRLTDLGSVNRFSRYHHLVRYLRRHSCFAWREDTLRHRVLVGSIREVEIRLVSTREPKRSYSAPFYSPPFSMFFCSLRPIAEDLYPRHWTRISSIMASVMGIPVDSSTHRNWEAGFISRKTIRLSGVIIRSKAAKRMP